MVKKVMFLICFLLLFFTSSLWANKSKLHSIVKRDDKGVWQIKSFRFYDAFEAMGYAVAEDRLWQMELYRRSGRGRLAEIFGPSQLVTDIYFRTIGYSEEELWEGFHALSYKAKIAYKAYAAGINRRLEDIALNPALLPFEFYALKQVSGAVLNPEPWTVTDLMALSVFIIRRFDGEALSSGQLDNARLIEELKARYPEDYVKMFNDMRWLNDPQARTMITPDPVIPFRPGVRQTVEDELSPGKNLKNLQENFFGIQSGQLKDRLDRVEANLKELNCNLKIGSFAFVVSGKKTTTGNSFLYSGPQMSFYAPGPVIEGSVITPGYMVSGMLVPGVPGIIVGRTPHHAWSLQVGHARTTDYYIDHASSAWLARMEVIKVSGGDDITIPVFHTSHGPVVNPMPFDPSSGASSVISWKYSHWKEEWTYLESILTMGGTWKFKDFGPAVKSLPLSMQVCYADIRKNIAFWMSGKDPVRPDWVDPRFPLLGDGTMEWIPGEFNPMPFSVNPEKGYFGGWNTKARVDTINCNRQNSILHYGVFHRGHVLQEYLESKKIFSAEDFIFLAEHIGATNSQGQGGIFWNFVDHKFSEVVKANPTPERLNALQMLKNWDGYFIPNGPAGLGTDVFLSDPWVLQDEWIREVLRLTFEDELATNTLSWKSQQETILFNIFLHSLKPGGLDNSYNWFGDVSSSGKPETLEAIILLALDNVLASKAEVPWNYDRPVISFQHYMLGEVASAYYASRPSYAQFVEIGRRGPVRIESSFPLGESGNILMNFSTGTPVFDPHFYSMFGYFKSATLRPFPLFKELLCK